MDATIKAGPMRVGILVVTPLVIPFGPIDVLVEKLMTQIESALVVAPFLKDGNHSLSAIAPDTKLLKGETTQVFA